MKFQPLNDNVLIKRHVVEDEEYTTPGGLIVRPTEEEAPFTATVLEVGFSASIKNMNAVTPGCIVVVGKFSGTDIKLDGEDFTVIRSEDILGVVSDDAEEETDGENVSD